MALSDTNPLLAGLDRPFAALIFDCDGTLADTMDLHYQAWVQALKEREAHFEEALFYELGGVPTHEIVRILNRRFGFGLPVEETVHHKEALYEKLLPAAPPIEPVIDLARQAYGTLPLAVASGGLRRLVQLTLTGLGVENWFQAVCTAEDVQRGKPEPDLFLLAAERLNVAPEACVVLEDSDLGLEAAQRAGMQRVDVRPWLPSSGPRLVRERRSPSE